MNSSFCQFRALYSGSPLDPPLKRVLDADCFYGFPAPAIKTFPPGIAPGTFGITRCSEIGGSCSSPSKSADAIMACRHFPILPLYQHKVVPPPPFPFSLSSPFPNFFPNNSRLPPGPIHSSLTLFYLISPPAWRGRSILCSLAHDSMSSPEGDLSCRPLPHGLNVRSDVSLLGTTLWSGSREYDFPLLLFRELFDVRKDFFSYYFL